MEEKICKDSIPFKKRNFSQHIKNGRSYKNGCTPLLSVLKRLYKTVFTFLITGLQKVPENDKLSESLCRSKTEGTRQI